MTHHLEIDELEQGGGLDVCPGSSDSCKQHPAQGGYRLTHVLAANLCAAFFQAILDVFLLVPLVVPQASDEVVEGFLEPAMVSAAIFSHDYARSPAPVRTSRPNYGATTPIKPPRLSGREEEGGDIRAQRVRQDRR